MEDIILKPCRIFLPQLISLDLLKDNVEIILEIFFVECAEKISRKLSFSTIIEDKNFVEYINDDHTANYLYKKLGTLEEIKKFYEEINSGNFFDFDLSGCKIDII